MHTGRTPCEDEGRDWVMLPQTKKLRRLPTNHQKLGEEQGTDYPSQPSERTKPAHTLILDFWPPELCEDKFLLVKPPSLWLFCYSSLRKQTHLGFSFLLSASSVATCPALALSFFCGSCLLPCSHLCRHMPKNNNNNKTLFIVV